MLLEVLLFGEADIAEGFHCAEVECTVRPEPGEKVVSEDVLLAGEYDVTGKKSLADLMVDFRGESWLMSRFDREFRHEGGKGFLDAVDEAAQEVGAEAFGELGASDFEAVFEIIGEDALVSLGEFVDLVEHGLAFRSLAAQFGSGLVVVVAGLEEVPVVCGVCEGLLDLVVGAGVDAEDGVGLVEFGADRLVVTKGVAQEESGVHQQECSTEAKDKGLAGFFSCAAVTEFHDGFKECVTRVDVGNV